MANQNEDVIYQNVDMEENHTQHRLKANVESGGNVYQDTSLGVDELDNAANNVTNLLQSNVSEDIKLTSSNYEKVVIEDKEFKPSVIRCPGLRQWCHSFWKPVRTKYHPLPHNATRLQKLKYACMCPPHGNLAWYMQFFILFLISWAVLVSITHKEALPGGNFFSLVILFYTCKIE